MIRKIGLIIQREYLSKIRKKSFWVMAFVGPLLLAIGMIVPLWFGMEREEKKAIEVVDETGVVGNKLISTPDIVFIPNSVSDRKDIKEKNIFYATLLIPDNGLEDTKSIKLFSRSKVTPEIEVYIENSLSEIIFTEKLKRAGLDKVLADVSYKNIQLTNEKFGKEWKDEQSVSAKLVAGLFSCVMILFFIVIYGGQVMRGVMEEKMNRIVEVMVSTVKPFELMMGKIIGIALVSLTQFLIWILLTTSVSHLIQKRYARVIDAFSNQNIESTLKNNPQMDISKAMEVNEMVTAFDSLDLTLMVALFLCYFVFGYLLYAALFAGIGSLVDSESDTQQFVFPLIFPLIFVMFFATAIMEDPNGTMAFWLSLIPFTSPVTMMLIVPFGVPPIQIVISLLLLVVTFLVMTWLSAKIYRMGILMYGKRITPIEIWRIIRSK